MQPEAVLGRRVLVTEKDAVLQAFRSGELSAEACEDLVAEVDARLFELEEKHEAGWADGDLTPPGPPGIRAPR